MRSDSWDLPVWGPYEVGLHKCHSQSVNVFACCTHDVGHWCRVTGCLNNPLFFISWTPFIPPSLALSKSSPLFSPSWEQVKCEIEFHGIWPVWLHPLFLPPPPHETHTRAKESKSMSVPSWESAFVLVLLSSLRLKTHLCSLTDGGQKGLWGKAKLARQLNYPFVSIAY